MELKFLEDLSERHFLNGVDYKTGVLKSIIILWSLGKLAPELGSFFTVQLK